MRIQNLLPCLFLLSVVSCQSPQEDILPPPPLDQKPPMDMPQPPMPMDSSVRLKRVNRDVEPEINNPKICLPSQFCFEQPQLQPNEIRKMWGTSDKDMWAVGINGTMLHFDGTAWSWTDSGSNETIEQIWGPAANQVWAVTHQGTILFYNGTKWIKQASVMFDPDSYDDTQALVGSGINDDVWLWGPLTRTWEQQVYRYDAMTKTWSKVDLDSYFKTTWKWLPNQFWMESANHLWMVGKRLGDYPEVPVVLYWNGTDLKEVYTISIHGSGTFTSIAGKSSSDIWVAGWDEFEKETIVKHFDGTTWTDIGDPKDFFYFIPQQIWIFGSQIWLYDRDSLYTLYRYSGTKWEGLPLVDKYSSLWMVDQEHVFWANQNDISRWDGTKTTRFAREVEAQGDWVGLWGSQSEKMWGIINGYSNSYLIRGNGKYWKSEFEIPLGLSSIWGTAEDDVWLGGDGLSLFHFDGIVWNLSHQVQKPEMGKQTILSIFGTSKQDVWAVGKQGIVLHYDGTTWTQIPSGTTEDIGKVWGFDAQDIWMIAGKNTILHFDGPTHHLEKIVAQGLEDSTILYAIQGIKKTKDMTGHETRSFWLSGGSNDTVKDPYGNKVPKGILWQGDGTTWTKVNYGSEQAIFNFWFNDPASVWAAAREGFIFKYDGTTWSTINNRGISLRSAGFFGLGSKLWLFGSTYFGPTVLLSGTK